MRRFLVSILLFFTFALNASARSFRLGLEYSNTPARSSHNLQIRSDFIFDLSKEFSINPSLSLGYSIAHYKDGYSEAIVYGYSFLMGADFSYKISDFFDLSLLVGADATYANFPVILSMRTSLSLRYNFDPGIFASCSLSHLGISQSSLGFSLSTGSLLEI